MRRSDERTFMARTAATEPAPPTSGSGTRYAEAASGDAAAETVQDTGKDDGDRANDCATAVAAPVRADARTRNTAAICARRRDGWKKIATRQRQGMDRAMGKGETETKGP